ncbi:tRNA (adenosine(37)-N6)-threonylcarbamoyltransferase complex ATPase subunit type 1 TsaE [Kordiimonas sp. SCSIO 12610]|uniref:tRNA (adenosine(37)-N6)-threonylcarbamoyltransferase complex ATPase subunit type 1 TsaE n=1 Tax=Kordiimonas sp. SCSIO 12610 TaxID=2829597 RepID=UPI002109F268|nr:tRNA (adenosine(37)-N6)-threonylcarbamoyltransferase complex ATPase subunit type 1 TsaE [Kordiimonas sp. SCSIO 12610]UTW55225.1 tRNA (adenosine(37)-N6)-threonylcarbamoyltransferase complex ATPase subunit type 1 TsaE [Kordiimonas sp. SCSIO 12610]
MQVLFNKQLSGQSDTEKFGEWLSSLLRVGDVVTFTGDLGAGKTTLVRALIRKLFLEPNLEVPSPTFTLLQTYAAPNGPEVCHADLYRLNDEEELYELGFEDMRENGIFLVEWPEKLPQDWQEEALHILLKIIPDVKNNDARELQIVGGNNWLERFENARTFQGTQ